jgi:hypothetical protein
MKKNRMSGYLFFLCLSSINALIAQSGGILPIYDDPMVFLDSVGKVTGQLPKGYKILNRPDGEHYRGWVKGMAVNTAGAEGLIPAVHYEEKDISLFDRAGKRVRRLALQYHTVTPNYHGFHLASRNSEKQFAGPTYFYLDRYGDRIFASEGYQSATIFHEGWAAVRRNNQWMYLDDLGREYPVRDTSLKQIRGVSPFYEGLSKIALGPGKKCRFGTCHDYVYTDKDGAIVLDTRTLLPGEQILEANDMHEGYALIVLVSDSSMVEEPIVYVHRSGRMIRIENVWRRNDFKNGLAVVVTQKRAPDGKSILNDRCYLIDTLGREIMFPTVDDMPPYEAFRLDDHIYYVSCWHREEKKGVTRLYDARLRKYVYDVPDVVMGVKAPLVSLYNRTSQRYYVVDYQSGKVVYDTDVGALVMTDIETALQDAEHVRTFVCSKDEDLLKLNSLPGITDLTLRSLDVTVLPLDLNLPALKKLKIDNLMHLSAFPVHLKNLEKIALRDCVAATNVMELLQGQTQLKELYLINFDLTLQQKAAIRNMFPDAHVVIEGSAKNADSELQIVIPGF